MLPEPTTTTTTLATIPRRLAARVIDNLLLAAVWFLPALLYGGIGSGSGGVVLPGWLVWTTWGMAVAYEIGMIVSNGQTIGKRLLGIRVADAVTGSVPNPDQAVRRAVPILIERLPLVGLASVFLYLPALWQPRRQGLHDRLAGTIVVTV